MSKPDELPPTYAEAGPGAYSADEHLRAQNEQKSASDPSVLIGDTAPDVEDAGPEPTPDGIGDDATPDSGASTPAGPKDNGK